MGEESKESQEMVTEKDYTEPTPELRRVTEEQFAEMEARFTKALADMRAALEAKTAEVERFRQQYTEEQTARRRQEFVDLAREKFSAIPGVADEIGARLLWLFDADTTPKKDHYTWFTNQLTAMNAVMAEHYREIGYTQPQPAGGGDAFTALLEQKRAALKQANPNLTDAEAYSQALAAAAREDPRGAARWYEKNS